MVSLLRIGAVKLALMLVALIGTAFIVLILKERRKKNENSKNEIGKFPRN